MLSIANFGGRIPPHLRTAIRAVRSEISIAYQSRRSAKKLRDYNGTDTHVHLGCGEDVREGWLNIDLPSPQGLSGPRVPHKDLVVYDLRRGLPLPAESCQYVFSSHFFEHLSYGDGAALMAACYRCLVKGGVFRAALPDLRSVFTAYVGGDEGYFADIGEQGLTTRSPGTEAPVDWVNYCVYQYGEHKTIYDVEKLVLVLRSIGFTHAAESDYLEGIDVGNSMRRTHSFYVEAVK